MKRTVFLLVTACLLASVTVCNAQGQVQSDGFRKGYRKLMQRGFMDLTDGFGLSDSIIAHLIPETQQEYQYFIDMSMHAGDSLSSLTTGYHKYLSLLDTKSTAQDNRLYSKIMYLGEFAQGEFAEFYYNITDKLVSQNQALFCAFYKRENSPKLIKLRRYQLPCK